MEALVELRRHAVAGRAEVKNRLMKR